MLDIVTESSLSRLAKDAEAYVWHSFGLNLELRPFGPANVPHFLTDGYRYWQGSLQGLEILLMAPRNGGEETLADIAKHRDLVSQRLNKTVILLLDTASPRLRKRLIERKAGFLVPGAQLYVPEIMLSLRERSVAQSALVSEALSPTAQLIVLAELQGAGIQDGNLTELASRLGVSIMSVSRALDELEVHGIAKRHIVGRQRRLALLAKGRELWDEVAPRLRSPIRKVRLVIGDCPPDAAPLAGMSALATYTNLSSPRIERRALPAFAWKRLANDHGLVAATAHDPERVEVESWSYDPKVLIAKDDNAVDRLSLYLSVRHNPDERVAQAASQLMEQMKW